MANDHKFSSDTRRVSKGCGAGFNPQADFCPPGAETAKLYTQDGEPVGRHFVRPTWESKDGSRVVGKMIANVPSPDANSVPWLLLTAISHEGTGPFSKVQSIRRLDAQGGLAPSRPCTANEETAAVCNFFAKSADVTR